MDVNSAQAIFGLTASVTPDPNTEPNVSGSIQIGLSQSVQRFPTATAAFSTRFLIAEGSMGEITLNENDTSNSDEFVAGTAQRETATAAGTITQGGNATVVFTATGVTGSPITLNVPVALSDTAAQWAEKVRVALAANTAIAAKYAISGTSTAIIATALPSTTLAGVPFYLANVSNLNISLDNGTCTGITTAGTSANTTTGVATSGCKVIGGEFKDVWGDNFTEHIPVGVLIQATNGDQIDIVNVTGVEVMRMTSGMTRIMITENPVDYALGIAAPWSIDATTGIADVTITVIGNEP